MTAPTTAPSAGSTASSTAPLTDFKASIETSLEAVISKQKNEKTVLTSASRVNEEQLYAALVHAKLSEPRDGTAKKFLRAFEEALKSIHEKRGSSLPLKAADKVLRAMIRSGEITHAKYQAITNFALGRSQLDSNPARVSSEKLDGTAHGDTALRSLKVAVEKSSSNVDATPEQRAEFRALQARDNRLLRRQQAGKTSGTTSEAGVAESGPPEQFVWKPISEKDGKLVILLPAKFTGEVKSLVLTSDSGKVLEKGNFSGVANGGREHFRFTKEGAGYKDASVLIRLKDGTEKEFKIPDTAERFERISQEKSKAV